MKLGAVPTPQRLALLASAVSLLITAETHAQAHGPSRKEIQQSGSLVTNADMRRERQRMDADIRALQKQQREDQEQLALLDPGYRRQKFADLKEFLDVMPGRYRIESRVEYQAYVSAPVVQYSSDESGVTQIVVPGRPVPVMRSLAVAGAAECVPVEQEADLRCVFEPDVLPVTSSARSLANTDATGTMGPAVLLLALEREQPALLSTLTSDGGRVQEFSGRMSGGVINSTPNGPCSRGLCFRTLDASATDDAERITLVLKATDITVTLYLHRVSAPVRDNVLRPDSALLSPGRRHLGLVEIP